MNRDEIVAMEPGQELDALVAEKVMGWVKQETLGTSWPEKFGWSEREGRITYTARNNSAWSPSTDISAAWEVADKMPVPFVVQKSYPEQFGVGEIGWTTSWCDNYGDCGCYLGETCFNGKTLWALTAPEAICKAALLSLLEKGNEAS